MSKSTESETGQMSREMKPFHDHPLHIDHYSLNCSFCYGYNKGERGVLYSCQECELKLHKDCTESFLNHPLQLNHFFKFFTELNYENLYCHFCLWETYVSAQCMIYNIRVCRNCVISPPPLTVFEPKHHKHSLTLLSRLVTFTCNACGLQGDRNPYVCLECNFMVHKDCTDLPRVININRHDHRISHTFHLGKGDWKCGVCRKTIDWIYGAFKCSRCPSYAVHSKCATRKEVWDGIELEDVPEEEEKVEDPFKIINEEGDIIHFSHENHILRLLDENCVTKDMLRCGGCVLSINGDPCYKCVECDFLLHKTCASFPRNKRHFLHNQKLVLRVDEELFRCVACQTFTNGFMYVCSADSYVYGANGPNSRKVAYDVRCSSLSEPFQHDLHDPQHPLYWTLEGTKECKACGEATENPLSCTDCEYALCMACATLPKKVKNNRCDDHFLSLSQGVGNSTGDLWCGICETKMDPNKRYYTCDECGVTFHVDCVIGDYYYSKVGYISSGLTGPIDDEILANNVVTRQICSGCEARCKSPFILKVNIEESVYYFCTEHCLYLLNAFFYIAKRAFMN